MKIDILLADVAQAYGFADQSHFTRIFSAATGLPRGHGAARPAMQVPQRFAEEGPPMSGRVVKRTSGSFRPPRWRQGECRRSGLPIACISVEVAHGPAVRLQTLNHNEPTEPDPQESPHVHCGI
ncbi:AraC family transcriptional regulator [Tardiphaga sp. OK246]|uniref:AraC family transcriptional regulator n=1 Tax=Tardiphaga sp. OK246 TaxID=1855307 RepID=UPI001131CB6C|nr:AraC family transcriptional regulator [Tardiphaga sp. OK246]